MNPGNIRPQIDWSEIDTENVVHVRGKNDLPTPSSGTITLENKAYKFDGFVTLTETLDISNGPVFIGSHGSQDGFIHTGGTTALTGTDGGFFARDFFFSSPNATLFNISGDQSTEMLIESCTFSDAANLGNITDLGTITGFRVPSFKGCNFEDFDAGITFDGNADKIFIEGSPFRNVTASNVTCLTLAGTSSIQIIDFPNNYFKDVQSDTEVWRVESGGEPAEVFQYRGNTHDTSVTKSNILTGPNADKDAEPFSVQQSYPLASTSVIGEMHNDGESTITISTQDTYTLIDATSVLDTAKRFAKSQNGEQEYTGVKNAVVRANLNMSFYGANGDIYTWAIAKNGTIEQQHTSSVEGRGKNANIAVPANGVFELQENDLLSIQVKNESNTNDPTILSYSFNAAGI